MIFREPTAPVSPEVSAMWGRIEIIADAVRKLDAGTIEAVCDALRDLGCEVLECDPVRGRGFLDASEWLRRTVYIGSAKR